MEGREGERGGRNGRGGKGMRGKEGEGGNGRNASGPDQVAEEIDAPGVRHFHSVLRRATVTPIKNT